MNEIFLFCLYCRGFSDAIFGLAVIYAALMMYDAQVRVRTLRRPLFIQLYRFK